MARHGLKWLTIGKLFLFWKGGLWGEAIKGWKLSWWWWDGVGMGAISLSWLLTSHHVPFGIEQVTWWVELRAVLEMGKTWRWVIMCLQIWTQKILGVAPKKVFRIFSGVGQLIRPSQMLFSNLNSSEHQLLLRKVRPVVKKGKQPFLMPVS